jgi:hypothetical protein
MNGRFPLLAACAALPALACVAADRELPTAIDPVAAVAARQAAEEADFLQQLQAAMAQPQPEEPTALMNSLEHLLPAWESEQRRGREAPIERILTLKVVGNLDTVIGAFERGSRERQLVAAWALGFARVPDNAQGIPSPHARALAVLERGLQSHDDALLRNVLLGLWKLGDPATPLRPLLDLMVHHHDPDVRSNATLAVGAIVDDRSFPVALDSLLVALADKEPKVRLHAAAIARNHPTPTFTARLLDALPQEDVPLVRASMAAALGMARSREAAPLLLSMLSSAREIESRTAHAALIEIYGVDRGTLPEDWLDLVR